MAKAKKTAASKKSRQRAQSMASTDAKSSPDWGDSCHEILQQFPDIIMRITPDGTITAINHTIKGLTIDGVLGTSIYDYLPPDQKDIAKHAICESVRTGDPHNYEVIGTGPEGPASARYETRTVPIADDRGKVVSLTQVTRDITQHRLMEAGVKEEHSLLYTLMNHLPDAVYFKDKNSRFIRIGRQLAKMFGLDDPTEAIGKTDRDFFTREHADQAFADEQGIMKSGQPIIAKVEKETWPDGSHTWASTTKLPLRDDSGEIIGTFGMSRDISEYSQASEALRESETKFRQLYTNAPTPYHTLQPDGTITNVNRQWSRTLGYERSEVVGKSIFDFVVEEEREEAKQSFEQKKEQKQADTVSSSGRKRHYLTKSGDVRTFTIHDFFYLDDDDKIASIHTTMEDVTEVETHEQELRDVNVELSKALEKLKRTQQQVLQHARLGAVGQMASGIAHDFNNALMPILGFSELLVKNPDMLDNRDDTVSMLKDIHDAAIHAKHVIRRLREFYRSKGDTERQFVDLSKLVTGVIGLTRSKWQEEMKAKGVTVTIEANVEENTEVHVDESQLREVLTNIVLNAVDAMPDGGTIGITSQQTESWTILEVSDTGVGMPKDVLDHCYEPFYSTKGTKGTGLGLSVAYGIISQHGGRLSATSTHGEGTTITISLPRASRTHKKRKKPETVLRKIPSLRILVADDEVWSRNLIKEILTINNHVVELAECGTEAVEKLRDGNFDMLVTDRAMPDMSGDAVAAAAKEIDPDIPVILLTGFGDLMKDTGEHPPGVDKIVSKPVSAKDLQAVIIKLTEQVKSGTSAPES